MAILEIKSVRGVNMEYEKIELPRELLRSIRVIIEKTKLFEDEKDFINHAIIKELRKYKEI